MRTADEIAKLRNRLIDQLEAAHATADEMGEAAGLPNYLIERALDELRADAWPADLDVPPKTPPR